MSQPFKAYLTPFREEMLATLESLVARETPSRDKPALDAFAAFLLGRFEALGLHGELVTNPDGGDHVRLHLEGHDPTLAPAVVLCHFDTVWPLGTLARRPFRVEAGRAYGPGAYDMKASFVLVEFAVRAFHDLDLHPPRPVVFLFTSDEEIGSPTSRSLIESVCRNAAYVLVMEPPLSEGRFKTARKGVGGWTLHVAGRSAHAGVEPEKGINALVELAHQILAVTALADPGQGTTLNIGVASGGTTSNVVPESASARIDVRVSSLDEARRIESALAALRPVLPGATVRVEGRLNRPPMERTEKVARLFEQSRSIALSLGMDLGEGSTGGGSDGNFAAALGVATLDGVGTPGGGAHADDEHVVIDALPERAALLAALLLELTGEPDSR